MSSRRDAWDAQADDWARFARTPGHDHWYERVNLPRFLELVPPAGRATLDLGCGEGRVGAELVARGHRVVGVDSSARMVELACQRHEAVVADTASLPFEDGAFDLVVAFMSVQDMDNLDGAFREAGRVLAPDGRIAIAIPHPIQLVGEWDDSADANSPFRIDSYLEPRRLEVVVERGGIAVTLAGEHRPLETYSRALEGGGFLVEALREICPDEDFVREVPRYGKWRRVPIFLHVRAVKA